ncbi:hypothetical protein SBADM41S_06102 [Streptomyces badius]
MLRVHEAPGRDGSPHLAEAARTPFGADAPLRLSAHLFRSGHQEAVLLLLLDHLAADAPSVGLLLDDLSALYTEYAGPDNWSSPLPPHGVRGRGRTALGARPGGRILRLRAGAAGVRGVARGP